MAKIKDCLIHWKKKIDRGVDEETILDIVRKLYKIPITVELLQETGIGKIVKQLGKRDGKVGEKATIVLHKWREVVSNSHTPPDKIQKTVSSGKKSHNNKKEDRNHSRKESHESKPSHLDRHKDRSLHGNKSSDSHYQYKSTKEQLLTQYEQYDNKVNDYNSDADEYNSANQYSGSQVEHESYSSPENDAIASGYQDDDPIEQKYSSINHHELPSKYLNYDIESNYSAVSYNPDYPEIDVNPKKRKQIEKHDEYIPTAKYIPTEISPEKRAKTSKSQNARYEMEISPPNSSQQYSESKKIKKSVSKSYEDNFKASVSSKSVDFSKSKVSSPSGHVSKSQSSTANSSKAPKASIKDVVKQKSDEKKVANGSEKKSFKLPSSPQLNHSEKPSVDKHKSTNDHKKKKEKLKMPEADVFTASEVSFEDCLGFNDIVPKKKKKPVVKSAKPEKHPPKSDVKETKEKSSKSKDKKSSKTSKMPKELLELPNEVMKIKEVDIISTLPEIQPFYKPLPPREFENPLQKKKVLSNEDAIRFTSSRKEKTAVYSGRRNNYLTEVPTLFESCIRVLNENVNSIAYTGGVPYDILKPVLERCSPQQLYALEDFNAYLLDDTHALWEKHCLKDFRKCSREEDETWRDMYLRVFEEQERKLKSITANISASMSKSNPVRQVKLAYVDSVVKPPRDVARKQARHGTGLPVNHPVKAAPPSKASPRPTAPTVNAAVTKSASTPAPIISKKPKVAPLMAKTLKCMKQVYRR